MAEEHRGTRPVYRLWEPMFSFSQPLLWESICRPAKSIGSTCGLPMVSAQKLDIARFQDQFLKRFLFSNLPFSIEISVFRKLKCCSSNAHVRLFGGVTKNI